ncbi:type IV secretion system protein [Novosphingobium terrae]|uniref:type IV secretion system protein n=1 Tax=Novosphingobium terrae TaxID=2726189 RepID=UPI0019813F69|nr:type IV secretion system protein [Novosphingobium terrae]
MNCPAIASPSGVSIADSLRAVDCLSAQATASAFSRLFGTHGALTAALTIALTLYVGFLALGLLSGRLTIGLGTLGPRFLALGLVLTFATSWAAYQTVVWSALTAGPDELASAMLGIKGSASHAFAGRLDDIFTTISEAAERARAAQADAKGTSPADLLTWAALIFLLGTVGVLVTSRIVLAALLAAGPVFVVLALFRGGRGLAEGWLKATVLFALVPLFAVLIGVGAVGVLGPMVEALDTGEIAMAQAVMVLMAAIIHAVLMALSLKVAGHITGQWRLFTPAAAAPADVAPASMQMAYHAQSMAQSFTSSRTGTTPDTTPAQADERVRDMVMALGRSAGGASSSTTTTITTATPSASAQGTSRATQVGRSLRRPSGQETRL